MPARSGPVRVAVVVLAAALAAAATPGPVNGQEDIDPCALVTDEEVSTATAVRGLHGTSFWESGARVCTFAQPYNPIANVGILQTHKARFAPGQSSVQDIFQAERAEETRPMTDVSGLGTAAYSIERAIYILVDKDTKLSVFVPGVRDPEKATQVARDLADAALARMK